MSENQEQLAYLDETALAGFDREFATGASGYVEEQVDVFIEETRTKFENMVNNYNQVVYRAMQAEADREEAYGEIQNLHQQLANAQSGEPVAYEPAPDNSFELEQTQARVLELEAELTLSLQKIQELETENELLGNEPVTQEIVAAPEANSKRVQQLLDAAADEARAHVERAIQQVEIIEAEAEEEVARIRAEAEKDAIRIKEDAEIAAADAKRSLAETSAEQAALFERIHNFYATQVQEAKIIFTATAGQTAPVIEATEPAPELTETLSEETETDTEEEEEEAPSTGEVAAVIRLDTDYDAYGVEPDTSIEDMPVEEPVQTETVEDYTTSSEDYYNLATEQ